MAVSKSTTFSESNVNVNTNTSSLTINIYFSPNNYETYFYNPTPLYCSCNGVQQVQYVTLPEGGSVSASFTFNNIQHNDDGSKTVGWSWNCNTGTQVLGNIGDSGNVVLTKINRTTTVSVSGTDIDGNFSVNYSKYTSENYQYQLRISLPNIVELERMVYNTSDEVFTLSQATIESLYSRYTATNTFNLGFAVETWSSDGQTNISMGNEVIIQARITGADPIFNDFTFQDTNSTVVALTGNNKINVNEYSNMQISIPVADKAVAQKGASMVKYRVVIGDKTEDIAYSNSSEVNTTINNCVGGVYEVYAIDSRGNSTLVRKQADSVKEYTPLTRNTDFKIERDDGGIGVNAKLTFSGTIWNSSFGSVSNGFTSAKYYLKKTDSSTWIDLGSSMTNITPTISGNTYSYSHNIRSDNADTTWDLESSYDIKVVLEDKLSSVEFQTVLVSAKPNISLSKNGVGIMCDFDDNLGGYLQVNGEVINSNKLVKEIELTSASNSINIDNLDLANDGGLYEIHIQEKNSSTEAGVLMKINNNNSTTSKYQEYSSSVNISTQANRIGRMNYVGCYILINISLNGIVMATSQGFDGGFAFIGNLYYNQSNVNSLQIYTESGTFGAGTKVRIYKK